MSSLFGPKGCGFDMHGLPCFLPVLLLPLGLPLLAGAGGDDRPPPATPPLSCAITATRAVVRPGEPPGVAVRVTNRTAREVLLVPCLDGSDYRLRYPHCYFEVTGPDGRPAAREPPRCGNLDPLGADQFVPVPAGAAFDPLARVGSLPPPVPVQLSAGTFGREGVYRVRCVYSTAAPGLRPWLGDLPAAEGAGLAGLLGRVPRAAATSNELRITVRGPGAG